MNKARVLITDDSVVVRRMLSSVLDEHPEIEVAGVAANGNICLRKIAELKPDLIVLDLEMPGMDGFETIRAIRQTDRLLPIIVFSAQTDVGARATVEALQAGATDYVCKPTTSGGGGLTAKESINTTLVPKIRALTGVEKNVTSTLPVKTKRQRAVRAARPEIIALGCSTGGPNALALLFSKLPRKLSVPMVIVQHMPPTFTKILADRLSSTTDHIVFEGEHGMPIKNGEIYIAPGGKHMEVVRSGAGKQIAINENPPENSCRPAVDVLFRSVHNCYHARALAIVLTGMGQDGLNGCTALVKDDVPIIVQDKQSSVVWGMPGAIAKAGLADQILPLDKIAAEITMRTGGGGR